MGVQELKNYIKNIPRMSTEKQMSLQLDQVYDFYRKIEKWTNFSRRIDPGFSIQYEEIKIKEFDKFWDTKRLIMKFSFNKDIILTPSYNKITISGNTNDCYYILIRDENKNTNSKKTTYVWKKKQPTNFFDNYDIINVDKDTFCDDILFLLDKIDIKYIYGIEDYIKNIWEGEHYE